MATYTIANTTGSDWTSYVVVPAGKKANAQNQGVASDVVDMRMAVEVNEPTGTQRGFRMKAIGDTVAAPSDHTINGPGEVYLRRVSGASTITCLIEVSDQ